MTNNNNNDNNDDDTKAAQSNQTYNQNANLSQSLLSDKA
jgi:hypothetical protein